MTRYKLTAALGSVKRTKTIHAYDQMDATMQAIHHIMDAAYKDQQGPWALGSIILMDPEGVAVHTMDAKV